MTTPDPDALLRELEALDLAAWTADEGLTVVAATSAGRALLGAGPGASWPELLHPHDRAALLAASQAPVSGLEQRVRDGSGWRWARVELRRARGQLLAVASPMAPREESARTANFEALVENLPFDFFETDARGVYVRMNQRGRAMWGDNVGKHMDEIPMPPERRALWAQNNRRAFAGEVVQDEITLQVNGEARTFVNFVAPIQESGKVTGILGVNIDTTARRRAEQRSEELIAELKRSLDALDQAQAKLVSRERLAALGELAAVVAHEVRNPLGAIFNSLNQLKKKAPPSAECDLLMGIIDEEASRLDAMVRDLLSYARPIHPTLSPEPLEPLLREALNSTLRAAGEGAERVKIELHVEPALETVSVDAQLLKMALTNIFHNALLAMPDGGKLEVRAAPEVHDGVRWVELQVRDTGVGIASEHLPRIFEPFFTTRAAGTGLGLAVVRRILEAHRGAVVAFSEEGKGATFAMYLPR